ncbi:MAG: phosphoglucosamine mutase [Candidatus Eisenbacteria bacterium]|nr:phosphoglucosamine mutase [Candidatus Latescibacterota bacterium]MBD3301032.1 phosphoglucosamine mutase [Candidatus Eisenbacteria bacterium]
MEEPMAPLMVSISGIRGIVGAEFHPLLVARWSAALADLLDAGPVVVARDSRPSGERFARVAADVLAAAGRDVWDLGVVPTPTVQVAVERWGAAGGLILTASHNPAPWNACKFVDRDGTFLSPERFPLLRERVEAGTSPFVEFERWGAVGDRGRESLDLHRKLLVGAIRTEAIAEKRPRVLLDCVHGAGGTLLPDLIEALGAEVTTRHAEPTGRFPRDPEPTGPPIRELAREAERCDCAFALAVDPDADRCAVAVPGSEVVGEEWTLPLVALHLLQRRSGTVVTNLSTSTRLEAAAALRGSRVERTPVGEAHVVGRMREVEAVLGGEGNGGVIDPAIHLGRDAAVAAAWLLEAHALTPGGLAELAAVLPRRYLRKGRAKGGADAALERLRESLEHRLGAPADPRDGLRWALPGGFVHVRSSATEPILRIVTEGETEETADERFELVRAAVENLEE